MTIRNTNHRRLGKDRMFQQKAKLCKGREDSSKLAGFMALRGAEADSARSSVQFAIEGKRPQKHT